jgi:hypothetical protein
MLKILLNLNSGAAKEKLAMPEASCQRQTGISAKGWQSLAENNIKIWNK